MREVTGYFLVSLFALSCVLALVGLGLALVAMVRLPFNVKPGTFSGGIPLNPLNVMFDSEKLTESGMALRRRMGQALAMFFGSLVVGVLAGMLVMLVR